MKDPHRDDKSGFTGDLAIQTLNLARKFGRQTAVDRIHLQVRYVQSFGLLSPNGAGKSTMIKMLTTLLDLTSGAAKVAGSQQKKQHRRRIMTLAAMNAA